MDFSREKRCKKGAIYTIMYPSEIDTTNYNR
jgi:hypothetical protein